MDDIKGALRQLKRRVAEDNFEIEVAWTVAAILYDRQTKTIIKCNEMAKVLFRGELLDRPLTDIIPERFHKVHETHLDKYFDHPVDRMMGTTNMNIYAKKLDGEEFQAEIILHPVTLDQVVVTIIKLP